MKTLKIEENASPVISKTSSESLQEQKLTNLNDDVKYTPLDQVLHLPSESYCNAWGRIVKIYPTTRPKKNLIKKVEIKDETLKGTIDVTLWGTKAEYVD